ncbi:lipase/esterase [Umbelopsis sp. PMI_123]|nr:lipase/esterase [Umbelopsis sp. PMI_123]
MAESKEIPAHIKMLLAIPPQEVRTIFTVEKDKVLKQVKPSDLEQPAKLVDSTFKGPETDIPIRVYTPAGTGPFPAILFFHGGGWVFGDIPGYDSLCRAMCVATEAVVISVDYRLSPEAKFPAAINDCFGALVHCYENSEIYDIDPSRIAVVGDSAGGNLAAAVTLFSRDHQGPAIKFQVLIYPAVDVARFYTETHAGDPMSKYFADAYLNTPEDAQNIYVSPLRADLTGLPPCFLLTCESDALLPHGKKYVEKLQQSGVPCEYINALDVDHGFVDVNKHVEPKVAPYQDAIFAALKTALKA